MSTKIVEQIKEYKELLDSGAISQEEYNELKSQLIKNNKNREELNDKNDIGVSSVSCTQCGSNDCEKINDYAYKMQSLWSNY